MSAPPRFDFGGARVLVTGGSNGIGHRVAREFAQAGADVTITGRRADAEAYDTDLSGLRYAQLEVRDRAQMAAVVETLDGLDVLINNAGHPAPADEWDPDAFEDSVTVNLHSTFRLSQLCKPLLQRSTLDGGGNIVNMCSMSSFFPVPIVPGYGASKAAIVQITKTMAVSWASDGLRVNAVAPGLIETNLTRATKGIEAIEKPQLDRTPMGRWGTTEEVAPAFLFLASPAARYITGQVLCVCGGYSAY